jgi:hypothetical protein
MVGRAATPLDRGGLGSWWGTVAEIPWSLFEWSWKKSSLFDSLQ